MSSSTGTLFAASRPNSSTPGTAAEGPLRALPRRVTPVDRVGVEERVAALKEFADAGFMPAWAPID